jgi:uncharacterized membrane-anchored protein YhcB (DUF1043 family)
VDRFHTNTFRLTTFGKKPQPDNGATAATEATVAGIEPTGSPSSVRQLQDAGKVVVGAAGTVAVDRVRAEVDMRSSRVAVELKAFANAFRASASSLREQGHAGEAEMVDQIAGRADRLAAHLATASTDELLENAKQLSAEALAYARREPALVVAGAFAIGLLIPKVLDVIATRRDTDRSRRQSTTEVTVASAGSADTTELEETVIVTSETEEDT